MGRCGCAACDEQFVSVNAFDTHRVGPQGEEFAPGRWRGHPDRRCLTIGKMAGAGWERTTTGWRHPKGIREAMHAASQRGRHAA
jgi:hypothetical protein